MKLDELDWRSTLFWDIAKIGGYYIYRRVRDSHTGWAPGNYGYKKETHHPFIVVDIEPLQMQCIVYHLLAGGKLDEAG